MVPVPISDTNQDALSALASSAPPGTEFSVSIKEPDTAADFKVRLTLAGFVDIEQTSSSVLTAHLPLYAQGASLSLSEAPKSSALDAWTAALSSGEKVPLVDEAELLKRDGIPDGDGKECSIDNVGKRKPCKDCSCGLADIYAEESETKAPLKSSCGSCSLGDAFRCAGCPYLGLPPFKPGEKVSIPQSFMTSDI